MKEIVLIGFGGHAKSVADVIERTGQFHIVGYTDIKKDESCERYRYLGADDVLENLFEKGVKYAAVCVGYMGKGNVRDNLYSVLKDIGYEFPVIIDPSAVIAESAVIGEGTFVGKGAIVNAEAKIGRMCIINSKSLVEHETIVEDYSHIAVGAVLCGQVHVKDHVMVGAGAIIIQNTVVDSGMRIKAGEVYH